MLRTLFKRLAEKRSGTAWDLSAPLLSWSPRDHWTLRDAVEGTLILGATGSGKTTGSGAAIARALLANAKAGGIVLTAKSGERELWERYCRETGRLDDLIIFGPDEPYRFNFLDFELNRTGPGAGMTENIVNLFSTVLEVAERNSGAEGGRGDEGFWRRANRQLMRNLVDLLSMAKGRVSVPELVRLCLSAPLSVAQVNDTAWKEQSFCFQCLREADERQKSARQCNDLEVVANFFLLEWSSLSDKTRSCVSAMFTSMADVFVRGILRELFCTGTNITPKAIEDGKILLIDLPVKEYGEIGQFAQVLWKYCFMRSIERREQGSQRPVFMWADEAQLFTTSFDFQFQSTARAARCATVYLSQSITNFFAALGGGDKGRNEALSLFSCLNTKVLHANTDATNDWAANLIGRTRQLFCNGNNSYSPDDNASVLLGLSMFTQPGQTSAGFSESYEFDVQPSVFTRLRSGSATNGWNVDALIFQNGRVFREPGRTWMKVTFRQKH